MYCGYQESTLSTRMNFTFKNEVTEVVARIYDHLKYCSHRLICSRVVLRYLITQAIPRDKITLHGDVAAIYKLFREEAQIDIDYFYDNQSFFEQCFGKLGTMNKDLLELSSWREFILKNINFFPPLISKDEQVANSHPVNIKALAKIFPWATERNASVSFSEKLVPESEISVFLLNLDTDRHYCWINDRLVGLYDKALDVLPLQNFELLFDAAMEKPNYNLALYLFCRAEKLSVPKYRSDSQWEAKNSLTLLSAMLGLVDKKISEVFIIYMIEKCLLIDMDKKSIDEMYLNLFAVCHHIEDYEKVLDLFATRFKTNFYALFTSILKEHKYSTAKDLSMIENMLLAKKIHLMNNSITSYSFHSFSSYYNENTYPIFSFNRNDDVTMTLLQAVIKWGSFHPNDEEFITKIIQLFIKHHPFCVDQPDSIGNRYPFYIAAYKRRLKDHGRYFSSDCDAIDKADKELQQATVNNALTLAQGLPQDVIVLIYRYAIEAKAHYQEKKSAAYGKSLNEHSHDDNSYSKPSYQFIIRQFCSCNQIPVDMRMKYGYSSIELKRAFRDICEYINKPVDGAFFLLFFEYFIKYKKAYGRNDGYYKLVEDALNHDDYLLLRGKRQFIENYDVVENKFIKFFQPKLADTLDAALKLRRYSDMVYLLKKALYESLPDSADGAWHRNMGLESVLKLIHKYVLEDKNLLILCDDSGNYLIHSLNELKTNLFINEKNINLIDQIIKIKMNVVQNTIGLFFLHSKGANPDIPVLPDEAYSQIANFIA